MAPRRKKLPQKSYQFKLPQDKRLHWLQALVMRAAMILITQLWSEEWLNKLGEEKHLKAYKVINEAKVNLPGVYLPSRIRRGIAERVGRIMRGQYKRMNCYNDCLEIILWLGFKTNSDKLLKVVMRHYRERNPKTRKTYPRYKKVMVEQTIAMIKKWHKRQNDFYKQFTYIDLVKPRIRRYAFPYGSDDEHAIKYFALDGMIHYKLKLPKSPRPKSTRDWTWVVNELPIPRKVQAKIASAVSTQPLKPLLLKKKLKGGKRHFFLQFPWEYPRGPKRVGITGRVLAVDFGLKKVATCVVCQNGKQISKAITIKLKGSQYRHIERLYTQIAGIQHQLAKEKKKRLSKQFMAETFEEERRRLYEKRNRLGDELAQTSTNSLIMIAQKWQCTKIVIEDLRSYKPPHGKRRWSRRLSEWLRGRTATLLEYKCKEAGLILQKVCPWNTSSHCPRCTAKGLKVLGPNNLVENKCGRFFHCPECGFIADRDYIAAVNIYRASFIDYQSIKSLKDTSPVPYIDSGIPYSTVPSEGPEMNYANSLVVVTGIS